MKFWKFYTWLYLLIALTSGVMSLLNGEFDPLWDSVNVATSLVGTFALWAFAYRKKVLSPTIWKTILLVMVTFEAVSYLVFDWYQDLEGAPIPVAVSLDLIFDFAVFVPMFLHSLSSNRVWAEKETPLEDRPRHGPIGRWIRECGTHFVAAASTIAVIVGLFLAGATYFAVSHLRNTLYEDGYGNRFNWGPPVIFEAPETLEGTRVDLGFGSFSDKAGGWGISYPLWAKTTELSSAIFVIESGRREIWISGLWTCPGTKISDTTGPLSPSMERLPRAIEDILLEARASEAGRNAIFDMVRCDYELSKWAMGRPLPTDLDLLLTDYEVLILYSAIQQFAGFGRESEAFETTDVTAILEDLKKSFRGTIWSRDGRIFANVTIHAEDREKTRSLVRQVLSTLSFNIDDPTDEDAILEKTRAALKKIPLVDLDARER